MTISDDEAVEAAALVLYRIDQWERVTAWPTEEDLKRGRSIFDPPPTLDEFKADYIRDARLVLAAAAPFIRAEALEEAADVAHDKLIGLDGSAIRATEDRGFVQRHNVSAAARWLRARAAEMRQGRDAES